MIQAIVNFKKNLPRPPDCRAKGRSGLPHLVGGSGHEASGLQIFIPINA